MFLQAVKSAVDEARFLLRTLGIRLMVKVEYGGSRLMMQYCAGTIEIPSWQGIRTLGPFRSDFVRTLLHEYGHALWDQRYEQLVKAGLKKIFGDHHVPYPEDLTLLTHRFGDGVPGYVSSYASAHPKEDFAETFAWVVIQNLQPPKVQNPVLRRKVDFMVKVLT